MTSGLDTSVVLRLLTGEPREAARAARWLEDALQSEERVIVSDLVAAEAYHALQHHYGMPEAETRALLRSFLTSGVVHLDPDEAVREFQPFRAPVSSTGSSTHATDRRVPRP